MSSPLLPRVRGALTGLALGDARADVVARRSPGAALEQPDEPALHTATTTWALALVDSFLYRRDDVPLLDDLALRARILAAPCGGQALRGRPQGFAGTLRQVAAALEKGEDPRLVGIDDVLADGLPAAVPLALALKDPADEVAAALVDVVTLTHRDARVVAAAGAFVFGLRSWLTDADAPADAHLEGARAGAEHALAALRERRGGVMRGRPVEAEGAVAIALAAARDAAPDALLAPPGYDGRDAPERLAIAALLAPAQSSAAFTDLVEARRAAGGDADVALPLLLAARGAVRGMDELPLAMLTRLSSRDMVARRAEALLSPEPPALSALVEEELWLSRGLVSAAPPDEAPADAPPPKRARPRKRDQLELL